MARIQYDWHNQPTDGFGYHFKSKIEFRWATYLDLLKKSDEIISWEYEPQRFDFRERYRRKGVYTPDFRVVEDTIVKWHEVKTGLRQKDVYRFRQMRCDYPGEYLVLVKPSCPSRRSVNQLRLLDNCRKYVHEIIYCGPIFRKLGI